MEPRGLKKTTAFFEDNLVLIVCFSFLLAVLLTGVTIFLFQKSRVFTTRALPIQAEVIEFNNSTAVFQYQVSGTIFESTNAMKSGTRGAESGGEYAVGDTATIFYNPENPTEIHDVLTPESSRKTLLFALAAGIAWLAIAVSGVKLLRLQQRQLKNETLQSRTNTRCTFVALEGTKGNMLKVVCRWIHPETGTEWMLRSASMHPSNLPQGLKLGMVLDCTVDYDDPRQHEINMISGQAA